MVGNGGSGTSRFMVDTTRPMASIVNPKLNLTGPGTINVTLTFSEKMSEKDLHVMLGSNTVQGRWINATLWVGKYSITKEYGPMKLVAYGAKDLAGNEMLRVSKSMIIDTKGPTISNVVCLAKVSEGSQVRIEAQISDDYSDVKEVMLFYKYEGEPSYSGVEMVKEGSMWVGYIPKNDVRTPKIEFYIVATDSFGNEMTSEHHGISVIPWYIVNWWIWLVLGILVLLFILYMFRRRKMREKAKEIPLKGFKNKNAGMVSKETMNDSGGEYDEFYE